MKHVANERGVALMLVLWVIVVIGGITAGVVTTTRGEANVVVNLRARAVARYAAESGVAMARVALREALGEASTPQRIAAVSPDLAARFADQPDHALGAGRFRLALTSLNGRIDLNNADAPTLLGFFSHFVTTDRAAALVDALQDWKDPDNVRRRAGAEAEDYRSAGSPYLPANRPLQRVDEITRIAGFTAELAAEIAPLVTVRSSGRIDVNAAPEPVLAAVPGLGPAGAQAIVSRRTARPIADLFDLQSLLGLTDPQMVFRLPVTTVPSHVLVVARGWQHGHPLTHEIQAVLEIVGAGPGATPRIVIRHWTERDL